MTGSWPAPGRGHNALMDASPPEPGAPVAGPGTTAEAGGSRPAGGLPPGFEWDQIRPVLQGWLEPLRERAGWMAALYLLTGMASAIVFLTLLTVAALTTVGLLFVIVGIFLIRPCFALAQWCTERERAMTGWVGPPVGTRTVEPLRGLGFHALRDPERWRQVGFLVLNVPIAVTLGTLGLAGFSIALQMVSVLVEGTSAPFLLDLPIRLIAAAVGVFAIGAAPRVARFVTRFKVQVTGWFLGPDQLARSEARVSELSQQREEILTAVASERRRIERNLHDGVQQRLVAIGVDLGLAERHLTDDPDQARRLIGGAREKLQSSIGELRQLGRGLHPAILEDRGIDAALSAVVADAPIPISVHVEPDLALPTDIAETVYFVTSESIANVLKHARARVASVHVVRSGDVVRVTIHDDGRGGADARRGTGLAGIRARVHGLDGTFTVASPPGGPTTVDATIPVRPDATMPEPGSGGRA
jgi:signal transduction histidine kinase